MIIDLLGHLLGLHKVFGSETKILLFRSSILLIDGLENEYCIIFPFFHILGIDDRN